MLCVQSDGRYVIELKSQRGALAFVQSGVRRNETGLTENGRMQRSQMKFSKILVPVRGHAIDDHAIQLACRIARQDKAKVLAATVIEIHRTLPLETENPVEINMGEAVLEHAEEVARKAGVQIETELLQARVAGPVLIELASERGIDLIILGIRYRAPLEEFPLGTTPRHIFRNARCQVWMCRQEATVEDGATKA